MHSYDQLVTRENYVDYPDLGSFRFRRAEDVVELARLDPFIGTATYPDVWHLDRDGEMTCRSQASSLDSLQRWAVDPWSLLMSRATGLSDGGCTPDWILIEPRPAWRHPTSVVDESDAAAFLRLRGVLARVGVNLLDAVIFDDAQHWWSLHELTSGTTTWEQRP